MKGRVFWTPESLDQGIIVYAKMLDAHPEYTINEHYIDTDVVYFKEGNNATISARRGEDYMGLRTNGKVDASNKDDMTTQLMIGFLPFLYHSNPRNAMIIGYGSGVTVGAAATFKEVEGDRLPGDRTCRCGCGSGVYLNQPEELSRIRK